MPVASVTRNGKVWDVPGPTDVLCRASAYALHHGIRHIWIDQYCIDQQDPIDKQEGIQAMDMVYQFASHPVAILESFVETQGELDALAAIFSLEDLRIHQIGDLREILSRLCCDAWFTRAWTLQESTSAGVSMVLMIGYNPTLAKPQHFGGLRGEIEVTLYDFQFAMTNVRLWMDNFLSAGLLEDETELNVIFNLADEVFNFFPFMVPNSFERSSAHRQTCNAAEAVNLLQDRENSVFSDRLEILSNMCNYEVRLDGGVLEMLQCSFSTCVLTLALLNGDMSLLGIYSDPYARSYLARDGKNFSSFSSNTSDLPDQNYGFSWGPSPTGCLRNIEYFETNGKHFQIRPALLSESGLRVKGLLWHMKDLISLPTTHHALAARWEAELKYQRENIAPAGDSFDLRKEDNRSEPLAQLFIWTLLKELLALNHRDMAITLWNRYQPRKTEDQDNSRRRTDPPLYSLASVFGLQSSIASQAVIAGIQSDSLIVSKDSVVTEKPSILRVIMSQVCGNGTLLCGSPLAEGAAPCVVFESCKEGDLVFTPSTELGDKACTESEYRSQATSWRVTQTGGEADGCDVIHCWGRRRGAYRVEWPEEKEYILE